MIKSRIKTFLISAFGLVLLCGAGFLLSACGHTHAFTDWDITEATCTEDGVKVRSCKDCDYTETVVIEKLGHDYGAWTPSGDFAMDSCGGTHFRECSRCQNKQTGECMYETETHKATCEVPGYNVHYCPTCGNEFEHDFTDALGHIWLDQYAYVKTEDGQHYHAQICANDRTHLNLEQLETCESSIDPDKTETVEASCGVRGYTKHTCAKCANTWETNVQDALEHNWQNLVQLEEMENGHYHHQYTCTNCQQVKKEICGETATYTQETCTTPSKTMLKCETCSREWEDTSNIKPAYGHSFGAWEQFLEGSTYKHKHKCLNCNEYLDEDECQFTETDQSKLPSCVQAGQTVELCDVCKYTKTTTHEKLDHEWEYIQKTDSSHIQKCRNCQTEQIVNCNFKTEIDTPLTCTTPEKVKYTCELCHREKIIVKKQPTGHEFPATIDESPELWEVTSGYHTRECIHCGYVEQRGHSFLESNICSFCNYDGLDYEVVDNHAVVYGNTRTPFAKNIIIADTYEGYPVTVVESKFYPNSGSYKGFYRNTRLETVLLPQSVEEIGTSCFYSCSALKTVNIKGEGDANFNPQLLKIGSNAFANCSKLTTAKNLPDGLTHIGEYAFYNCTSLAGLTIPDSVIEIGDHAFTNTAFLNNLESQEVIYVNKHLLKVSTQVDGELTIKEGIITIADEALKDCAKISKIIMYGDIKEIGKDAFLGCNGLTAVEYKGTFDQWFEIVFENDYSSPMSHASALHIENAAGAVKIPYGTTKIPAGTFKGTAVTSIEIPETVTSIGEEAFENCASLTSITIVDKEGHPSEKRVWQYIGKDILKNTTLEGKTTDESGVVYFDVYLIDGSGLNTGVYTVRTGTKSISAHAFENNPTLTSITFDADLEFIGEYAFVGCSNLNYLKFEDPNNWFAWSELLGRTVDADTLDGGSKLADGLYYIKSYYTGNWNKTKKK